MKMWDRPFLTKVKVSGIECNLANEDIAINPAKQIVLISSFDKGKYLLIFKSLLFLLDH